MKRWSQSDREGPRGRQGDGKIGQTQKWREIPAQAQRLNEAIPKDRTEDMSP